MRPLLWDGEVRERLESARKHTDAAKRFMERSAASSDSGHAAELATQATAAAQIAIAECAIIQTRVAIRGDLQEP